MGDAPKLLEILKSIRAALREYSALSESLGTKVDNQEEQKETLLLVSGESISMQADDNVGKVHGAIEKLHGTNHQVQIIAGDVPLMVSDPRSIQQAREESGCEHLLAVTSKIEQRFKQNDKLIQPWMQMDDLGLEISFTYTNENSVLTVVEPYIMRGKRWAAFEILSDSPSRIHVGVVPVADFEKWGCDGWTCLDDIPRLATQHAVSPGRFISLGSGCLIGCGYGVDWVGHGNTVIQPDKRKIRYNSDGDGMCEGPEFYSGCKQGDIIGVLVDCDKQSLCFFRNGEQWGPGYATGVVPPLAFAVDVFLQGVVKLLPDEPVPDAR